MDSTVDWGDAQRRPTGPETGEAAGLRELKKQATRQRLTDVATRMFLDRGFDAVRVADVAAACDVSEKTVYNYFASKEALVLDRWQSTTPALAEVLADTGVGVVDAALRVLAAELDAVVAWLESQPDQLTARASYATFGRMLHDSESLQAHQRSQVAVAVDRLAPVVAARLGQDEPRSVARVVATALVALWDVQDDSLRRHMAGEAEGDELVRLVGGDVARAAAVLGRGLDAIA